jgi:hypothetical protein
LGTDIIVDTQVETALMEVTEVTGVVTEPPSNNAWSGCDL